MLRDRCEVWVARLAELAEHEPALAAALTPGERADVAGRADRGAAVSSRAVLRLLLARYLDVPAAEVAVDRTCPRCGGPHGRPRLLPAAASSLVFSVSHGGGLLVLAFAGRGRIGVDVEPEVPGEVVAQELVEMTLTLTERERLASAPADRRQRLFLHHWTGKEAVLKALGTGLDLPLQAVTLPGPPAPGSTEVTTPDGEVVRLAVRTVDVGAGHVCALASTGPVAELQVRPLAAADLATPPPRP